MIEFHQILSIFLNFAYLRGQRNNKEGELHCVITRYVTCLERKIGKYFKNTATHKKQ